MIDYLKLLLVLAICLSLACESLAGNSFIPMTGAGLSGPVAAGYTGPGDVQAGALVWYGLRAYNSTRAGGGPTTNAVIDVRGVTTSGACTIFLLGNGTGGLDFSTAGAGGVGNQCSSGATTFCTVTNTSCTISKLYDQTGNGFHLVQATAANQPTLTFSCYGSLPCMTFNAVGVLLTVASSPTQSQPFTYSSIFKPTSCAGGDCSVFVSDSANTFAETYVSGAPAVIMRTVNCGATTFGAIHSVHSVWNTGASAGYIDGTSNACVISATPTMQVSLYLGNDSFGDRFVGSIGETGAWAGAMSAANLKALCQNQSAYYSLALTCN